MCKVKRQYRRKRSLLGLNNWRIKKNVESSSSKKVSKYERKHQGREVKKRYQRETKKRRNYNRVRKDAQKKKRRNNRVRKYTVYIKKPCNVVKMSPLLHYHTNMPLEYIVDITGTTYEFSRGHSSDKRRRLLTKRWSGC